MDFSRTLSSLVFLLCVLISLKNQNAETNRGYQVGNRYSSYSNSASKSSISPPEVSRISEVEKKFPGSKQNAENSWGYRAENRHQFFSPSVSTSYSPSVSKSPVWSPESSRTIDVDKGPPESLRYNYYRDTCGGAEQIVKSVVHRLFVIRPDIGPALLRLFFHDCFVQGCDASILLDPADGIESEKDSPPNISLRGFDVIDIIKSELEETCPGVVSCADIVVLAARESVILGGGPFYPLQTGRRDSNVSCPEVARDELPRPEDDLSQIIEKFGSRGFSEKEIVGLLGAHSTGRIRCKFFLNRLYNFSGTDQPDPSIDSQFLKFLRSKCGSNSTSIYQSASPSLSPAPSLLVAPSSFISSSVGGLSTVVLEDPRIEMDYEGPGLGFGTIYYQSLLQHRGVLYTDQQLTAGEETKTWVRAYASDLSLFQKNFAAAMMKLSNHQVLTAPMGQVRLDCRNVA